MYTAVTMTHATGSSLKTFCNRISNCYKVVSVAKTVDISLAVVI